MLTLNIIMWRIRKLFRWRPGLWKEFKYVNFLWETTREAYDEMKKAEKEFMVLIRRDKYDEVTMKKLHELYICMNSCWVTIRNNKWRFEGKIEHKCLQLSPVELKIFYGYREAAYRSFYSCCGHMMDAKIKIGRADPSEKDAFLNKIAHVKDNKQLAFD
jgi:hypothetical protein